MQLICNLMCVGGPSTVEVTSETSLSSLPALMSGFLSKLEEARRVVGEPNFIGPQAAKAFLEDDPSALLLDVQDCFPSAALCKRAPRT